jgi:hypothetical protein
LLRGEGVHEFMIILDSTRFVVEQSSHVTIDDAAIDRWAEQVRPEALAPSGHELLAELPGDRAQLANLVLLIDALNFCFWSDDPIRFEWRGRICERFNAMLVSLLLAARADASWFEPTFWLEVSEEELRSTLSGRGRLLLMEERLAIVRETARVLLERFDGRFLHAVESVNERAWPLAVLLLTQFDSFADVARYRGQPVYFLKRAQICALDLSFAWQTHGHGALSGLDELTAFADYRVPQALRHLGILRYRPELSARVEGAHELESGSEEEVEIRAACIHAVDRMARSLAGRGKSVPVWRIDGHLWELSHQSDVRGRHHRTRSVYY